MNLDYPSSDQVSTDLVPSIIVSASEDSRSTAVDDINFDVFAAPNPLTSDKVHLKVPEGTSLQETLEQAQPDEIMRRHAHIFIEDQYIPRKYWHRIYPKKGTHVVIRCIPHGGGGGGSKGILRIVLFIAVIAAAFILPGLILGAAAVAVPIVGGLTVGGLLTGGITLIGGLLVNVLVPLPSPADPTKGGSTTDKPALYLRGIQNSAKPFGIIPRILGAVKVVPDFAALPYTEYVGKDQYLRVLFCIGYGPLVCWSHQFGETDVFKYEGVQMDFRRGYQPWMFNYRGGWGGPALPVGANFGDMYTAVTKLNYGSLHCNAGDTITYSGPIFPDDTANWDVNAEKPITLFPNTILEQSLNITLNHAAGLVSRATDQNADEISLDLNFPGGIAYIDAQTGNKYPVTVKFHIQWREYGSAQWFDAPVGTGGIVTCTGHDTKALHFGYQWATGHRDQYEVAVQRTTTDDTSSDFVSVSFWTALRTIIWDQPVHVPEGLCMVAFRVKATDQLSGVINDYNVVAESILRNYDPPTNTWKWQPTQNPASHFVEILTGVGNSQKLTDDMLDWTSITDFWWWCQNTGAMFNMAVNSTSSVTQMLDYVCGVGKAAKVLKGGRRWGVTIDRQQPAPAQMFTPRNSWEFSGVMLYPKIPHAFRCSFNNFLHDWATEERIVYDDGYSSANATIFEQLDMVGVTDPNLVFRLARYHLAQVRLRPEEFTFKADIEHIVCERGDWVVYAQDVISSGLGSGRISAIYMRAGDNAITAIDTDEQLEMQVGWAYAITIRTLSNAALVVPLVGYAGLTNHFTFLTPLAANSGLQVGNLLSFGLAGQNMMDLIVKAITPAAEETATIVCMPASPTVWIADQVPIPDYNPQITPQPNATYPAIQSVVSGAASAAYNPIGTWIARIQVNLNYSGRRPDQVIGLQAQYRISGSNASFAIVDAPTQTDAIYLGPVQVGSTYEFQLRYRLEGSGFGSWGPLQYHTVLPATGNLVAPTNIRVIGMQLYWDYPNPPPAYWQGFVVRYEYGNVAKPNWSNSIDAHLGIVFNTPVGVNPIPSPATILVKTLDVFGNLSPDMVTTYWPGADQVDKAIVQGYYPKDHNWPGIIAGLTTDGSNNLTQIDSLTFWTQDNAAMWTVDTNLFWGASQQQGTYRFSWSPTVPVGPSDELWMTWTVTGSSGYKFQYWDDVNLKWVDWPLVIKGVENKTYSFMLTMFGGVGLGILSYIAVEVKANVISEGINAFSVASTGTRYPVAKHYRVITGMNLTVFNPNPSDTITPYAMDYNVSPGPLIQCFRTSAGKTPIAATVSGTIYGVATPTPTGLLRELRLEDFVRAAE